MQNLNLSLEPLLNFVNINPVWVVLGPLIAFTLGVVIILLWAARREHHQGVHITVALERITKLYNLSTVESDREALLNLCDEVVSSSTGGARTAALRDMLILAVTEPSLLPMIRDGYPERAVRRAARLALPALIGERGGERGTEAFKIIAFARKLRPLHHLCSPLSQKEQERFAAAA
ncbi:MAG: hypothetical protein AAB839_00480 [Patescibacteria group bacterium]